MARIYRWIRKVYALLVLLAAVFGVGPGKPAPVSPPAPAPSPIAPTAKKVVGSCATGSDGAVFFATCVVDGAQTTLPGVFPTRATAQQAIRDFRAANA